MQLSEQQKSKINLLERKIDLLLIDIGENIKKRDRTIDFNIGLSNSECFLIRKYISFSKIDQIYKEASIVIDVRNDVDGIEYQSDFCGEDGEIILEGPNYSYKSPLKNEIHEKKWLILFESFIENDFLIHQKLKEYFKF